MTASMVVVEAGNFVDQIPISRVLSNALLFYEGRVRSATSVIYLYENLRYVLTLYSQIVEICESIKCHRKK